jgi:NADPH-dependent glutamate synthase beta subunit-like oxidoreductase/NAD(P)H-flavin reductase
MNAPLRADHATRTLQLAFGFTFTDLYESAALTRLDSQFVSWLSAQNADLAKALVAARHDVASLAPKAESELLIALAPYLDDFVGELFGIAEHVDALSARHDALAPLSLIKRKFVQRKAMTKYKADEAAGFDGARLRTQLEAHLGTAFDELSFATQLSAWLKDEAGNADAIATSERYAAWAAHTPAGRAAHQAGVLFKAPNRLDPMHLVHVDTTSDAGYSVHKLNFIRRNRQDKPFNLTDAGGSLTYALDQANYCIWCHEQGKDSCSKGLTDKPVDGKKSYKKSPFGVTLAGCPLEEKISEFHKVKTLGHAVGALGIITIDNPMAAATGHRICNDCMKSCIYQRQDPVNIPQAETRTLKDVLELPWGFEIYSLLTRWNPLNIRRPAPLAASHKRVLVVGMGPAGFTLAHHLMNDGHTVVGVDGLKIEPLPAEVSGVTPHGERASFAPVYDTAMLFESLDDRIMAGFGGVAEYGITVRWDKNFLKLIRLLLERRASFQLFGGVRFGGTLTTDDAFALGFDHIALCAGAGKPTVLDMPNGLAKGVRTASDFLMGLQLTGAAKEESIANLQVRLPIVVIGGGLTAVDTATESLAYYPRQVEKFLSRYEKLIAERGEPAVRASWSAEDGEIAAEFIGHAKAIRAERDAARREAREPRIIELLQSWGGSTIAYRKRMVDSPSYTLNHEEVELALQEGISFAEGLTPVAVEVDAYGAARGLKVKADLRDSEGKITATSERTIAARTILVAAGTQPNTVLAREDGRYKLDGKYFEAIDLSGNAVKPERLAKPDAAHVLMHRVADGRFVSFFGDLHPSFFGNVVKAMGSAKQGYPIVSRALAGRAAASDVTAHEFAATLNDELRATVHAVHRLTPTIVEVVVKAPRAARGFLPGQFYRLQNFESLAPVVEGTRLAMEGLALTGASVDKDKGLLSTIVLEMGGSSDLCAVLKPGEPVILMGPTGTPTEVEANETVVLVGGGLGNAVLFSIGAALRAKGSRILYFAGYKKLIDRYKVAEIEAAADEIVWCSDEAPGFALNNPARPQDKTFVGNIVQAMLAHAEGRLGIGGVALKSADRFIVIGSDRMMAAVAAARHSVLASHVKANHFAIGSINSPMQCMMKEICAQCLQPQIDPVTGEKTYVFSCFNQDQALDRVDWRGLNDRLQQNSLQEKLTAQWVDRAMKIAGMR